MKYYPKSRIKTNLYTNGNEFEITSTSEIYTGYYYELSTGEKFTGKDQTDKPNILLSPLSLSPPPPTFLESQKKSFSLEVEGPDSVGMGMYLPLFNSPLPTPDNYKNGVFIRYFCQKTNERTYLEIDESTYNKLVSKDPSLLWSLYSPFSLEWKITPNQSLNETQNFSTVNRTITQLNLIGFNIYIKNYSQYTPPPPITSNISQLQPNNSTPSTPPPPPSTSGGGNSSGGGY